MLPFFPTDDAEVLGAICRAIVQDVILPGAVVVTPGGTMEKLCCVMGGSVRVMVSSGGQELPPAEWMLADTDLLKANRTWRAERGDLNLDISTQWLWLDDGAIATKTAVLRDELVTLMPSKLGKRAADYGIHADAIKEANNSESPKDALIELIVTADEPGEWRTLAVLQPESCFGEACLIYTAPSFMRYQAKELLTIGVVAKDTLTRLVNDYPSLRGAVMDYSLLRFDAACKRLERRES